MGAARPARRARRSESPRGRRRNRAPRGRGRNGRTGPRRSGTLHRACPGRNADTCTAVRPGGWMEPDTRGPCRSSAEVPVDEDEQEQPDDVDEVPVPGGGLEAEMLFGGEVPLHRAEQADRQEDRSDDDVEAVEAGRHVRSEEHTSELQSLMRSSYAVFCLDKKNHN